MTWARRFGVAAAGSDRETSRVEPKVDGQRRKETPEITATCDMVHQVSGNGLLKARDSAVRQLCISSRTGRGTTN